MYVCQGEVKPKLAGHKEFHNGALSAEYKNPIDRPHLCQLLPGLTPLRMHTSHLGSVYAIIWRMFMPGMVWNSSCVK
jgi:hypothetical protein